MEARCARKSWRKCSTTRARRFKPTATPRSRSFIPRSVSWLWNGIPALLEFLKRQFEVFAPDLPGHGLAQHAPAPLLIEELSGLLLAWLTEEQIDSAAFVGQSTGVEIIAHAAVRRPEAVDRIAMIGPTPDPKTGPCSPYFPASLRAAHLSGQV